MTAPIVKGSVSVSPLGTLHSCPYPLPYRLGFAIALVATFTACATLDMQETAAVATEVDLTRQCLEVLGPDPVRALDQTEAYLYERMIDLCDLEWPTAADQAEFSRLRIVYEMEMEQP